MLPMYMIRSSIHIRLINGNAIRARTLITIWSLHIAFRSKSKRLGNARGRLYSIFTLYSSKQHQINESGWRILKFFRNLPAHSNANKILLPFIRVSPFRI